MRPHQPAAAGSGPARVRPQHDEDAMRPRLLLTFSCCMAFLIARPAFAGQGYLVTMAGNGVAGSSGDGGQALHASMTPTDITFDANGNIFFLDGSSVRKVRPDGVITTVATLPETGAGLAVAKDGTLFVAMSSELRRIAPNGAVATYPETVTGLAMGPDGSLYMADPTHHRIRRMVSGVVSTFAGTGIAGDCWNPAGLPALTSSCLQTPRDVVVGADGTVFLTDIGNHKTWLVKNGEMRLLSLYTSVPFARTALGPDGNLYGLLEDGNLMEAAKAAQVDQNYTYFVAATAPMGTTVTSSPTTRCSTPLLISTSIPRATWSLPTPSTIACAGCASQARPRDLPTTTTTATQNSSGGTARQARMSSGGE